MPCPPANSLDSTLQDLKVTGATVILSMLAQDEMRELGLEREATSCAAHGQRFISYPITDFGLPDLRSFGALIKDVVQLLSGGEHVVVHCRAGIGRSGMVAACVLVALDQSAQTAVKTVSEARGVSIPDTVEQGEFIEFYAQSVRSSPNLTI